MTTRRKTAPRKPAAKAGVRAKKGAARTAAPPGQSDPCFEQSAGDRPDLGKLTLEWNTFARLAPDREAVARAVAELPAYPWVESEDRAETREELVTDILTHAESLPVGFPPAVFDLVLGLRDLDPSPNSRGGGYWAWLVMALGAETIATTAAMLGMEADVSRSPENLLSRIGDGVSVALRQRVLLFVLKAADWNLNRASRALRLGKGTGNILRAIKDLGLESAYASAKASGMVRRGRPKGDGVSKK